jgi:uncharacterized protein YjiS (DUF1127 family)
MNLIHIRGLIHGAAGNAAGPAFSLRRRREARELRAARRALAALNDRELADMGLTRGGRDGEAAGRPAA